MVKGERER